DHGLGPGRKMRPSVRRCPGPRLAGGIGANHAVALQQRAERQAGDTHAHVREEGAAGGRPTFYELSPLLARRNFFHSSSSNMWLLSLKRPAAFLAAMSPSTVRMRTLLPRKSP